MLLEVTLYGYILLIFHVYLQKNLHETILQFSFGQK